MSDWSADPVADWVLRRGRHLQDLQQLLDGICTRVRAQGMPLDRVAVFLQTLHPQYFGFVLNWQDGETSIDFGSYEQLESDAYLLSPMAKILEGERIIRRVLHDPQCSIDFPVLEELCAAGFTDYVLVEMVFSNGSRNGVSLATRAPQGFSEHDIKEVQDLLHLFALIMENHVNRGIAASVLDTYLGSISGARVLDGQIKRGDGDYIDAVIWFSDLRDSTRLAESLGRTRFLELLNDYFEATAGAVLEHGGEVLRFIGDASLAVFPIADEGRTPDTCRQALTAARDARNRAARANAARAARDVCAFSFGIGLHRGEVLYGNIGTPERLEFSVVGPAANETARIEALCKSTGTDVVVSETVARHLAAPAGDTELESLGAQALRGVGRTIEVFALR